MAGILHSDSIVADSTISPSSPCPFHGCSEENNDPLVDVGPPLKVKRIARTYGRPKAKGDVEEIPHGDVASRARVLKTAPRDADDQVIPESDDAIESGPKFAGFGWRKKLKEIDEGVYYSGDGEATLQREVTESGIVNDIDTSNTRREPVQTNESCIVSSDSMTGNSLFDGSLSSLLSEPTSNSLHPSVKHTVLDSDSQAAEFPRQNPLVSYKHVYDSSRTSDSDDISPQHPYLTDTPKQRSSSTPPTSPLEGSAMQGDIAYSEAAAKSTKKGKDKAVDRRTKALTKKEVVEMQKESARILADQHVSIERTHARPKHTVATFFEKLNHLPIPSKLESDPIVPFSSPGIAFRGNCSSDDVSPSKPTNILHNEKGAKSKSLTLHSQELSGIQDGGTGHIPNDDTEEELPDADALLRERNELVEVRKRAMGLGEQKRKALEAAKRDFRAGGAPSEASDTDDDLEVEGMVSREDQFKNSEKGSREHTPHTIRGNKATIGSKSNRVSRKDLEQAAKPVFLSRKAPKRQRGRYACVSQKGLNELLLCRAESQGGAIEEKKKEQWVKAGGVLKEHRHPVTDAKLVIDGLSMEITCNGAMEGEGEEDADDPEYEPGEIERREGEESDAEASDTREPDGESGPHEQVDISDEDADKENYRPPRKLRVPAVVDSDDEREMSNHAQTRSPVVFAPDTSLADDSDGSSGGDKENSAELAFSVGENKENEGVPRHPERGRVIDMSESYNRGTRSRSSSPVSHVVGNSKASREPLSRLDTEVEFAFVPLALTQRRDTSLDSVLQLLHEDTTLAPIGSMKKGVHRRSSLTCSEPDNLDGSTLVSPIGFSQLFDETRVKVTAPGPVLGSGGFSQFFSQGSDNGDSLCATPLKGKMRSVQVEDDNFEFTQPNTLLPSIRLSESQRREVDTMFGKDQEFKLDEAKASRSKGEHGTRSILNTLHFGSFVASQTVDTPRSIRRPLETLSLEGRSDDTLPDESPRSKPARSTRLLRERPRGHSSTSQSSPRNSRNAFDVLRDAAFRSKGDHGSKETLAKSSEYVEVEAQESDEEAMIGFGGAKANDDDEVGDDNPDHVVEGLVDDTIVDEKADLVLQKHMEHQAVDDAALEKLHQDAVDGKLRGKRRDRGIGFEDSDSDEDDLSSSRKALHKKRRIDGDTLDDYGKNPETLPFYNAYQVPLTEPDESVAYIQEEDSTLSGENIQEDSSDNERTEAMDPINRRQTIIDQTYQSLHSSKPELDPQNVNWVDSKDQEIADLNGIRVEDGPLQPRKAATLSHVNLDHMDYSGGFQSKKTASSEERQLKIWASQESRAYTSATGRGGFSRKDSTASSVSRQPNKLAIRNSDRHEGKAIVKQSSLISHVEKRKGFDG